MAETVRRRLRLRARLLRRRLREQNILPDNLLFLSRLVRAPKHIGAIAPSSRGLGRAMTAELPARFDVCVELGGGTGSLTRAILNAGVPGERLIVIERDPRLGTLLRRRFPGVRVIVGDAQELGALLRHEGIERVDAIVSGLPLRSLPRAVGDRILAESFRVLVEGGPYVQFTYGLIAPIPAATSDALAIEGEPRAKVWNNLPPATVWRYRHKRGA